MHAKLLRLYPTLFDPMDCSPPDFSVHGILQARILEWVDISPSRGSSQPQIWNLDLLWLLRWQVGSLPLCHLGSPLNDGPPGKALATTFNACIEPSTRRANAQALWPPAAAVRPR